MKTIDFTDLIELMEKSILKMKEVSEPKRWRAEQGETYYYMDDTFNPYKIFENGTVYGDTRHAAGNYFQTEAECQEFCDKVKSLLR